MSQRSGGKPEETTGTQAGTDQPADTAGSTSVPPPGPKAAGRAPTIEPRDGDEVAERLGEIGNLLAELSERAAEIERISSGLATALAEASRALESAPGAALASSSGGGARRRPPRSGGLDDGVAEEALIRATRMAIEGVGREQVAEVLRSEHEIADPDPILDRILGPGSG